MRLTTIETKTVMRTEATCEVRRIKTAIFAVAKQPNVECATQHAAVLRSLQMPYMENRFSGTNEAIFLRFDDGRFLIIIRAVLRALSKCLICDTWHQGERGDHH
jgi:hypothetical protein